MLFRSANRKFALAVEPDNAATVGYQQEVARLRAGDRPSLPSTLGLEIQVNPFLRCEQSTVRTAAQRHANLTLREPVTLKEPAEVFAVLRAWKDGFR